MGLTGHDEVNIILPGANYGWPRVIGAPSKPESVDPIYHSGATTWAPSGCSFVRGAPFEDWANNLLFAALRGEHLHRVVLDTSGGKVVASERLFQGVYGRLRDVVQGPDGYVYLLTSNRDGRGVPRQGDDKVLRLTPI
jgi:glucose/arabinose dehydrogenase